MAADKVRIPQAAIALISAVCVALALGCCAQPAAAQSIGKATAVKNQVEGVRGGATRKLAAGGAVFSNDTVRSGANSLAQLLFVDQTTFTVGANSQAVLSSVYRGKRGVVHKIMRAVAGAFRFVSGLEAPGTYQIRFPQGYLTVRGTIVDILAGADHSVIIVDEGAITIHVYASGANYDLTAGHLLAIHSTGQVDGPITMDPTIMQIDADIPFPLFGSTLWPTQGNLQGLDVYEAAKDRNDMLNASSNNGGRITSCPPGTVLINSLGVTFCYGAR